MLGNVSSLMQTIIASRCLIPAGALLRKLGFPGKRGRPVFLPTWSRGGCLGNVFVADQNLQSSHPGI